MKNTFVKVLSFMMALTMIVGAFGAITVSAAACAHENRTETAVVAPTCATAGFTSYKCNDCGETFIDSIKNATGNHTWKDVPASKATCDENGYAAHKVCTTCPAENPATDPADLSTIIIETKLGHVWNIPYTQAATCTEDGFTSKKCARCGKVDDRIAPEDEDPSDEFGWKVVSADDKAAHKYIYTVVTAPTACTSGSIKVTCSACDYNATIAQTEDHDWKDMSSEDAAAMLTEKGIVVGTGCNATYKSGKICIDCGAVKDTVAAPKTHAMVEVDYDTITSGNLTAEIAALGYKVGDATSTDVFTCTVAREYLAQCSICKAYGKATETKGDALGHEWNAWGDVTPADTDANHAVDKKQTRTCKNCTETETKTVKAATPCVFTKEGSTSVIYPTCGDNGYTEYVKCDLCSCANCAEDAHPDGEVKYATGHTYGEWQYVEGYNCLESSVTNAMVRYCTNKDKNNGDAVCNHPEYKDATAKENHDFVKETIPATCIDDAKYQNKCKECGLIVAIDPATDAPAAGKNPNNHVAKVTNGVVSGVLATVGPDADEDGVIDVPGLLEANIVEQTCTTSRVDRYMCQCGVARDLTVGAAPAHNEVEGGTYHKHAAGSDACTADCKSVATKPATCKAEGIKTAGKICTVCGVVTKAPEVAPIDPTKHDTVNYGAAVPVESAEATCVARAYTKMYYPCCQKVDKIESGDVVETAHGAKLKNVAAVAATCTSKGVAAHQKCEACGLLWKADQTTLTKANAVTLASLATATADGDLVHDWKTDAVAKVPETCTATGTKAYYECNDCTTHIKVDGQIVFDDPATTDKNERTEALKIAAHGTKHMGWQTGKAPTCTEAGYRFKPVTDATKYYTEAAYCCAQCDKIPVDATGHKDVVIKEYNLTSATDYNCTLESYKVVECSVCKTTYFKEYAAAAKTAHEYTKYTEGDNKGQDKPDDDGVVPPTCTTAGVYKYSCVHCEYVDERPGAAATGHAISVNGVSIKVNFGCASEDHKTYKGFKCACGAELGKDADLKHNVVTATAKLPTCTTPGNDAFNFCVDCGKIVDGSVVEIPATGHSAASTLISTENGINKYSCPVCGEYWTEAVTATPVETLSADKIAAGEVVTYTLAANGKVEFNAETIKVYYDATMLTFVGVEANADLAGLYAFASVNAGSIGVALVVENDAEGNAQKVVTPVDGTTVLFTLTFVANKTASGNVAIGAHPVASERPVVEIAPVGNLNGDAVVTAADAQAIFAKVGSNDAAADVNNDGIVNFADVAALATFAASNKTAKDYLVMVGEYAAIEAEVYALLDAGRLANHDTVTNVINVNDALALIAEIEAGLAGAYATLGNNVTAAAVVAYYNAK